MFLCELHFSLNEPRDSTADDPLLRYPWVGPIDEFMEDLDEGPNDGVWEWDVSDTGFSDPEGEVDEYIFYIASYSREKALDVAMKLASRTDVPKGAYARTGYLLDDDLVDVFVVQLT